MTWQSMVFSSVRMGHRYQLIALHFAVAITLELLQSEGVTCLSFCTLFVRISLY